MIRKLEGMILDYQVENRVRPAVLYVTQEEYDGYVGEVIEHKGLVPAENKGPKVRCLGVPVEVGDEYMGCRGE
jgi:hypothetical protein